MSIANMLIESMMNGGEYHEMMGFHNEFMGGHGYSDYMDEDSYMYDSEDDYETLDGEDSRGTEEQKRMFKQLEDHIFKGYVHRTNKTDLTYKPMHDRDAKKIKKVQMTEGFIDSEDDDEPEVISLSTPDKKKLEKEIKNEARAVEVDDADAIETLVTDSEDSTDSDCMIVDPIDGDSLTSFLISTTVDSMPRTNLNLISDHGLPNNIILPSDHEAIHICNHSSTADLIIKLEALPNSKNNDETVKFYAIPVHSQFLIKNSSYFENLLNKDKWNDSLTKKIGNIPTLELKFHPHALILLLKWLYTNEFNLNPRKHSDLLDAVCLYRLCDELCLTQCCEILEKFFEYTAKTVCFKHLFRPHISILTYNAYSQMEVQEISFDATRIKKDFNLFMQMLLLESNVKKLNKPFIKLIYSEPLARLFLDDKYSEWMLEDADAKSQIKFISGTVLLTALTVIKKYAGKTVEMYTNEADLQEIKDKDAGELGLNFREKWSGLTNLMRIIEEWMKGQVDNDEMKSKVYEKLPWNYFTEQRLKELCKYRKTSGYYCETFEKSIVAAMKVYLPKLRLTITCNWINTESKKSKELRSHQTGLLQDLDKLFVTEKEFELSQTLDLFVKTREEINQKLSQIEINMVMVLLQEEADEKKRNKEMEQTLSKLKNQKLDDAGKLTKFSVPIVTDYDISKLPGYKVETDRSHFHSRFEMHESDQPHPVIVQAVEKNDLKTLQKMIYHADKLLEFDEKLMISSSKGTDRKTNKVDHKEFVFKEEALNASRIHTEVVEKYGYDKSWEWYSALK